MSFKNPALKISIVLAIATAGSFGCAHIALAQTDSSAGSTLQQGSGQAGSPQALILSLQKQVLELLKQIQTLQLEVSALKSEAGFQAPAQPAPVAVSETTETTSEEIPPTTLPEFTRPLSLGARGDDVRKLQEFLARDRNIYPEGLTTGYYGPKTAEAVKRWQRKNNIEAIGIVGPKTIAKFRELGRGVIQSLIEQGAGRSGVIPPGLLMAPGIQRQMATSTVSTSSPQASSGQATTTPTAIPPMMATVTPPVIATTTPAVPAEPAIPAAPATPAQPTQTSAIPATPATPAQPATTSGTTSLDWTRLTNGCNPKTIWNGSEYGVVWGKVCNSGENEIYFNRFTNAGIRVSQDLLISTGHMTADSNYTLAWSGTEYAVLWEDYWGNAPLHSNTYSSYSTYFSKVSSQGQKSGADVKIGTGGQYQDMHLFWNGSEYVLIYINYRPNDIRFRKFSSNGQNLGSIKIISSPNKSIDRLSVIWTGTEYNLTWNYFQAYGGGSESVRLSANGDLINQTAPVTTTASTAGTTTATTTTSTIDVTPPTITLSPSTNPTPDRIYIGFTANEEIKVIYEYGLTTNYGSNLDLTNWSQYYSSNGAFLDNLPINTTYHIRAKATDRAGNVGYSTDYTFTTFTTATTATTLPAAPTSLFVSGSSPTSIGLYWADNSTDESEFRIDRRFNGGSWSQVGSVTGNTTTKATTNVNTIYTDNNLSGAGTYDYRVKACNNVGCSAESNIISRTIDAGAPVAPSGLTATASANSIAVSWTDNSTGEWGFRLKRRVQGSTSWFGLASVFNNSTGNSVSFTDSYQLIPNTIYEYIVHSYNTYDSAGSNIATINFGGTSSIDASPPSAPTGVAATVVSSSQINLSWNASTDNVGVTAYQVFRNGLFWYQTTNLSAQDTGLSPNTSYSYYVRALDAALYTSSPSATVSATTQPEPPVITSGPAATRVDTTEYADTAVSWTTNIPCSSVVSWGGLAMPNLDWSSTGPSATTHQVILTTRFFNSTFNYKVKCTSSAGGAVESTIGSFATEPEPTSSSANCFVKVNGSIIKSVTATDRNDCYNQTSFGSRNCSEYDSYFLSGSNLLEQYFGQTDRVNSDTCTKSTSTATTTSAVLDSLNGLLQKLKELLRQR